MIVQLNVVLNRTVVDSDWRFLNLSGNHLQSQSESKVTTTQVVETSVNVNNSLIQDYATRKIIFHLLTIYIVLNNFIKKL